jgi:hypothetical protein
MLKYKLEVKLLVLDLRKRGVLLCCVCCIAILKCEIMCVQERHFMVVKYVKLVNSNLILYTFRATILCT